MDPTIFGPETKMFRTQYFFGSKILLVKKFTGEWSLTLALAQLVLPFLFNQNGYKTDKDVKIEWVTTRIAGMNIFAVLNGVKHFYINIFN